MLFSSFPFSHFRSIWHSNSVFVRSLFINFASVLFLICHDEIPMKRRGSLCYTFLYLTNCPHLSTNTPYQYHRELHGADKSEMGCKMCARCALESSISFSMYDRVCVYPDYKTTGTLEIFLLPKKIRKEANEKKDEIRSSNGCMAIF